MWKKGFIFISVILIGVIVHYFYQTISQHAYLEKLDQKIENLESKPLSQLSTINLLEIADYYVMRYRHYEKALPFYEYAMQRQDARATYMLAFFKAHKVFSPVIKRSYSELYQEAATLGSLNAQFILRVHEILEEPTFPISFNNAVDRLYSHAKIGDKRAILLLCEYGQEAKSPIFITQKNFNNCQKLAEQNYAPAQYFMGRLHEQNEAEFPKEIWAHNAIPKSIRSARSFYGKAAGQGYEPAIKRLHALNNSLPLTIKKAPDPYAYQIDIAF